MEPSAHEAARSEQVKRLREGEDSGEDIEKIMDFFGPDNIARELREKGFNTGMNSEMAKIYRNWKLEKLNSIFEKRKESDGLFS